MSTDITNIPEDGGFTSLQPQIGFTNLPTPLQFTNVPSLRVQTAAEKAQAKMEEQYRILLEKKLKLLATVDSKTKNKEVIPSLTEPENQFIQRYEEAASFDQMQRESSQRNRENALASYGNTPGQIANLALGAGTGAVNFGLNVLNAPLAAIQSKIKFDAGPETYAAVRNIEKKLLAQSKLQQEIQRLELEKAAGNLKAYAQLNSATNELSKQQLTPEEQQLKDSFTPAQYAPIKWAATKLESHLSEADKTKEELSKLVNTYSKDIANYKLNSINDKAIKQAEQGDIVPAIGTYLGGIVTLMKDHPNAALQYFADSSAHTVAFMVAPIPALAAVSTDLQRTALNEFEKEHGRMPSRQEQAVIASVSVLSAAADMLGAQAIKGGSGALKSLATIASKAGLKLPSATFAKTAQALLKPVGVVTDALVVEGSTEAFQSAADQYAIKQDLSKIDPKQVMLEGQIGAATGGIMSAPTGAVRIANAPAEANKGYEIGSKLDSILDPFMQTTAGKGVKNIKGDIAAVQTINKFVDGFDVINALSPEQAKGVPLDKVVEKLKPAIAHILNNPGETTPKDAANVLRVLDQAGLKEVIEPDTLKVLQDISNVNITSLASKTKQVAEKIPGLNKVIESADKRIERGKAENNPETVILGIKEKLNRKTTPEESSKLLQEMESAIQSFEQQVENEPSKGKKIALTKSLNSYKEELKRKSDAFLGITEKAVQKTSAETETKIDSILGSDPQSIKPADIEEVSTAIVRGDKLNVDKLTQLAKHTSSVTDDKTKNLINSYIKANTIEEVGSQVEFGGGKDKFSRGTTTYKKEMDVLQRQNAPESAFHKLTNDLMAWYYWHSSKPDLDRRLVFSPKTIARVDEEAERIRQLMEHFINIYETKFEEQFIPDVDAFAVYDPSKTPKALIEARDKYDKMIFKKYGKTPEEMYSKIRKGDKRTYTKAAEGKPEDTTPQVEEKAEVKPTEKSETKKEPVPISSLSAEEKKAAIAMYRWYKMQIAYLNDLIGQALDPRFGAGGLKTMQQRKQEGLKKAEELKTERATLQKELDEVIQETPGIIEAFAEAPIKQKGRGLLDSVDRISEIHSELTTSLNERSNTSLINFIKHQQNKLKGIPPKHFRLIGAIETEIRLAKEILSNRKSGTVSTESTQIENTVPASNETPLSSSREEGDTSGMGEPEKTSVGPLNDEKSILEEQEILEEEKAEFDIDKNVLKEIFSDEPISAEEIASNKNTIKVLANYLAKKIKLKNITFTEENTPASGSVQMSPDGTSVVINLNRARLDTPVHEILAHPIVRYLKNTQHPLYDSLLKELDTPVGKQILQHVIENHNTVIEYGLEFQKEEAIVRLLGLYTAQKIDKLHKVFKGDSSALNRLIDEIKKLYNFITDYIFNLLKQDKIEVSSLSPDITIRDLATVLAFSKGVFVFDSNTSFDAVSTRPEGEAVRSEASQQFEVGRFVKYNKKYYIITKFLDNGLIQIYSPLEENNNKKLSVKPSNLFAIKHIAKKVTYKDTDYLVTDLGAIISLKSNREVHKGASDPVRIAVLSLAQKTQETPSKRPKIKINNKDPRNITNPKNNEPTVLFDENVPEELSKKENAIIALCIALGKRILTNEIKFFYDKSPNVIGGDSFISNFGNTITINLAYPAEAGAPYHEIVLHPLIRALRLEEENEGSKLYSKLVAEIQSDPEGKTLLARIKKRYPASASLGEDFYYEEAIVTFLGRYIYQEQKRTFGSSLEKILSEIVEKIRNILKDLISKENLIVSELPDNLDLLSLGKLIAHTQAYFVLPWDTAKIANINADNPIKVTEGFGLKLGQYVKYENEMYIVTSFVDERTIQIYSPIKESNISVHPDNVESVNLFASLVRYKDKNYFVTRNKTIFALKGYQKVNWSNTNPDRIAVLLLAQKAQETATEKPVENKPAASQRDGFDIFKENTAHPNKETRSAEQKFYVSFDEKVPAELTAEQLKVVEAAKAFATSLPVKGIKFLFEESNDSKGRYDKIAKVGKKKDDKTESNIIILNLASVDLKTDLAEALGITTSPEPTAETAPEEEISSSVEEAVEEETPETEVEDTVITLKEALLDNTKAPKVKEQPKRITDKMRKAIPTKLSQIVKFKKKAVKSIFQILPYTSNSFTENVKSILNDEQKALLNKNPELFKWLDTAYKALMVWYGSEKCILHGNTDKDIFITDIYSPSAGNTEGSLVDRASWDLTNLFLQTETGKDGKQYRRIHPQMVAIISVVMLEWMGTRGGSTIANTPEVVKQILGISELDEMPKGAYEELAEAGVTLRAVQDEIGNKIYKMLELSLVDKKFAHMVPKLKIALGQLATTAMLKTGYFEEKTINIAKYINATNDVNVKFIKAATQEVKLFEGGTVNILIDSIAKIEKVVSLGGTALREIFSLEKTTEGVSFEKPQKPKRRKVKNSTQFVSDEVNDILSKHESRAWTTNTSAGQVFPSIDLDIILAIGGFADPTNKHVDKAKAIKSKNNILHKQYRDLMDLLESLKENPDQDLFFTSEQWKSGRIGLKSNTVNMLHHKMHRMVLSDKAWIVNVDFSDPEMKRKFLVGIGQALDIKISKIKDIETIIAKVEEEFKNPMLVETIRVLQQLQKGNKEVDQKIILEAVEKYGEGYASLKGLIELTKAVNEVKEGDTSLTLTDKPFTTDLTVEIDGKTNGIAFSIMQAAINENGIFDESVISLLNACGVLTGGQRSFAEWYDNPESLDIYEMVAKKAAESLSELTSVKLNAETEVEAKPYLAALSLFINDFAERDAEGNITKVTSFGRKFVKEGVIPKNFGAGVKSIQTAIYNAILDNIKDAVAECHVGNNVTPERIAEIENAITVLMSKPGSKFKFKIDRNNALKFQIEDVYDKKEYKQYASKRLKTVINGTYGEAITGSMNSLFGGLDTYKLAMDRATSLMFEAFNLIYKEEESKLKQKIFEETEIERDLSSEEKYEILASLEAIHPSFRGYFSKDKSTWISVLDTTRTANYETDRQQQVYNQKVGNSKSTVSTPTGMVFTEPGGKATLFDIHNKDVVVQLLVMFSQHILNIHDASVGSFMDIETRGNLHNAAFLKVNTEHHGLSVINNRLNDIIRWIKKRDEKQPLEGSVSRLDVLNTQLKNNKPFLTHNKVDPDEEGSIVEILLAQIRNVQISSVSARQQMLEAITGIDQYPIPGGVMLLNAAAPETKTEVTEQQEAAKLIDEVTKSLEKEKDTLGSEASATLDADFSNSIINDINPISLFEIFEDLHKLGNKQENTEHRSRLLSVLNGIVNKILRPHNEVTVSFAEGNRNAGITVNDKDIFISTAPTNPAFPSVTGKSAQEVYVHELVHTVAHTLLDKNFSIKRQVVKLYDLAKSKIKPEDLIIPIQPTGDPAIDAALQEEAKKEAQEIWDYIFNSTGNGLYEFVAYGLTNEAFIKALQKISVRKSEDKSKNIFEKLTYYWNALLDYISNRFYKIQGKGADEALFTLISKIQQTKDVKASWVQTHFHEKDLDALAVSKIKKWVFKPLEAFYYKHGAERGNKLVAVLGMPIGLFRLAQREEMIALFHQFRRRIGLVETSFWMKLAREIVTGERKVDEKWHTLHRKAKKVIDQARKHEAYITEQYVMDNMLSSVLKGSEENRKVLHRIVCDTDLQAIFDKYSKDELIAMLGSEVEIDKEIDKRVAYLKSITKSQLVDYYNSQANGLGYFMVTGEVVVSGLNLNANNIARRFGTSFSTDKVSLRTIQTIDQLASLYALKYSKNTDKLKMIELINAEYAADSKKNGITESVYIHRWLNEESKKKLFENNEALMQKGYTAKITNPRVHIKIGSLDEKEQLEKEGYTLLSDKPLKTLGTIPSTSKVYLFVTRDATLRERIRTIASITSESNMGTTLQDIYYSAGYNPHSSSLSDEMDLMRDLNKNYWKNPPVVGDLRNVKEKYALPLVNNKGNIVDFRFVLSYKVRRDILEQDERIEKTLGMTNSSIVDKSASRSINEEMIDLAKEDYDQHYTGDHEFITISADTADGDQYKEIYKLLPKATKEYMKQVWGEKKMHVRAELLDLMFGYRKASIVNAKVFGVEIGQITNNFLLNMNNLLLKNFPKIHYKGNVPLRAAENIIQDFVKIIKDLIVVKSVNVLLGNLASNFVLLYIKGVPPSDIVKYQREAYSALDSYYKDWEKQGMLERQIATFKGTTSQRNKLKNEIAELQKRMDTNPVASLLEEGMFQSIIEDIEVDSNIYNTGSKIANFVDQKIAQKLPVPMLKAAKYAWISRDTALYQFLYKMTQYGDFIGRYALWKHRISEVERENLKPVDARYKERMQDILNEVVETFVNYDTPTSPEMQYMNDIGFMMFTKFLFRIQKVVYKTVTERPASTLSFLMLRSLSGVDVPTISDSTLLAGIINRIKLIGYLFGYGASVPITHVEIGF